MWKAETKKQKVFLWGSGPNLCQERFQSAIRKNFFTEGVVRHWNRLLRDVGESSSLESLWKDETKWGLKFAFHASFSFVICGKPLDNQLAKAWRVLNCLPHERSIITVKKSITDIIAQWVRNSTAEEHSLNAGVLTRVLVRVHHQCNLIKNSQIMWPFVILFYLAVLCTFLSCWNKYENPFFFSVDSSSIAPCCGYPNISDLTVYLPIRWLTSDNYY